MITNLLIIFIFLMLLQMTIKQFTKATKKLGLFRVLRCSLIGVAIGIILIIL